MSTTSIILLSIAVFLVVVLIPVTILVIVRKKLAPQGKVKININDEKEIEVEPGNSLLATLANEQIFLPSACGGGGSCGMCRCQVLEGGGTILPTETGFFSRKEQQNHWRLGCQVKVREDMKIHINPQIFGIKKWECEVVSNRNVATFIKEFVVKLPEGEHLKFLSGGLFKSTFLRLTSTTKTSTLMKNTEPTGKNSVCSTWSCTTLSHSSELILWPVTQPKITSSCSTCVSLHLHSTESMAAS